MRSLGIPRFLVLAGIVAGASWGAQAQNEISSSRRPVRVVADSRLAVEISTGQGLLPLYMSEDWSRPRPDITRAVIVLHGVLRDADVYLRAGEQAQRSAGDVSAGSLLIVPQFLAGTDVAAHKLSRETLRWRLTGWEGGEDAEGPAPISSFDALDAIVKKLADARIFPALRHVVFAGHSGGGQVVQRYAMIGHAEAALGVAAERVGLRYVVANPSSYAWPGPERPDGQNGFVLPDAAACPGYDTWKYGLKGLPRYAGAAPPSGVEAAYLARDVIYLLGMTDTNPAHRALDRSCAAQLQGPYRLARGQAFISYLRWRHPEGLRHRLMEVEGVGHNPSRMFGSACGRAALFDGARCDSR